MLRPIIGLLAFALLSPAAHAAESYDNCTGTITSLPTTISTQGTWCLKDNLATTINIGAAITVSTNNVTINCNDFRFGGLGAGPGTNAFGIQTNALNTTVRNCGIRGFLEGIHVGSGASGALIEHNRLDQNTQVGVSVEGSGHMVRLNRVVDTGGRPASAQTIGIRSAALGAQITDNSVVGMTVTNTDGIVTGIISTGNASEVARNYITGLVPGPTGSGFGIDSGLSTASSIHRNQLLSAPDINGIAIQ